MVLLMWIRKGLAANQQTLNLARQMGVGKVKEAPRVQQKPRRKLRSLGFQLQIYNPSTRFCHALSKHTGLFCSCKKVI